MLFLKGLSTKGKIEGYGNLFAINTVSRSDVFNVFWFFVFLWSVEGPRFMVGGGYFSYSLLVGELRSSVTGSH
jgi:hypothetical protein